MPGAALSFVDFPDTDDFWGTFTADTAGNTVRHLGNGIVSSLIPSAGYFDFEINKPSGRLDLVGDLVINGTINFVN